MTREEKDKQRQLIHDMAAAIKMSEAIAPKVDHLYSIDGRRYRCVEVSQRVDDENGDITIETVFKREYTRFEEFCSDGPKEVLD